MHSIFSFWKKEKINKSNTRREEREEVEKYLEKEEDWKYYLRSIFLHCELLADQYLRELVNIVQATSFEKKLLFPVFLFCFLFRRDGRRMKS